MNMVNHPSRRGIPFPAALVCLLWFGVFVPAWAQAAAPVRKAAVTNAAPATIAIPLSVFVIPTSSAEGRDPFFPNSTHFIAPVLAPKTTNAPVVIQVELSLKGISGPADHRLAIINNKTFQAGEEGEVTASGGKVRIRCLEIKEDAVEVQVGSERRELRLRSGI